MNQVIKNTEDVIKEVDLTNWIQIPDNKLPTDF
jgi:hypothetical protein